jgi:hypothetical protein
LRTYLYSTARVLELKKFQAPTFLKFQITRPKCQTNPNDQNSKPHTCLEFDPLEFEIYLEFGV